MWHACSRGKLFLFMERAIIISSILDWSGESGESWESCEWMDDESC